MTNLYFLQPFTHGFGRFIAGVIIFRLIPVEAGTTAKLKSYWWFPSFCRTSMRCLSYRRPVFKPTN